MKRWRSRRNGLGVQVRLHKSSHMALFLISIAVSTSAQLHVASTGSRCRKIDGLSCTQCQVPWHSRWIQARQSTAYVSCCDRRCSHLVWIRVSSRVPVGYLTGLARSIPFFCKIDSRHRRCEMVTNRSPSVTSIPTTLMGSLKLVSSHLASEYA